MTEIPPSSGASRGLFGLGAAAAAFYVAAQVAQAILDRFVLPVAPDPAAAVATRLLAAERGRQMLVLGSLFLVPLAYVAIASARWTHARGACLVGLAFGVIFAAFESGYRAVDLFAGGAWAAEFVATVDRAQRAALLDRFGLWNGIVRALYLPLLASHALASAAFAVAVGFRRVERWDLVLAIALVANAVRALLRILQMHAGVGALAPVNAALYLPVTLLTYGLLAAWLARAAAGASSTMDGAPPGHRRL